MLLLQYVTRSQRRYTNFKINNRGYGSIFDGDQMEIQLCSECAKK